MTKLVIETALQEAMSQHRGRDYFPKGTTLARHTPADLKRVHDELNDRPRKCLEWRSPAEALAGLQSPEQWAVVATFAGICLDVLSLFWPEVGSDSLGAISPVTAGGHLCQRRLSTIQVTSARFTSVK